MNLTAKHSVGSNSSSDEDVLIKDILKRESSQNNPKAHITARRPMNQRATVIQEAGSDEEDSSDCSDQMFANLEPKVISLPKTSKCQSCLDYQLKIRQMQEEIDFLKSELIKKA